MESLHFYLCSSLFSTRESLLKVSLSCHFLTKNCPDPFLPQNQSRIPSDGPQGFPRAAIASLPSWPLYFIPLRLFPALLCFSCCFSCSFLNTTRLFRLRNSLLAIPLPEPPSIRHMACSSLLEDFSAFITLFKTSKALLLQTFAVLPYYIVSITLMTIESPLCFAYPYIFLFFRLSTLWGQLFCFFYSLLYPQPSNSDAW